jgi:hypothetical protein
MTTSPINYLKNPSFESDLKSWGFWWAEPSITNPHDPSNGAKFQKPEVDVLSRNDLPEHERDLFILDGDHTLKIAKYCGAWSTSLRQITDLPQGTYTLQVNVFGDLVKGYTDAGEKIWGDDPQGRDGLMRFVIGGVQAAWLHLTPGAWNSKSLTFKANGLTLIHVDVMCPFPLRNSGIFADNWTLTRNPETYVHVYTVIPKSYTMQQAVEVFRKAWGKLL